MNDSLTIRIGRRTKVFRELADLTQDQLAERLGFNHRQTVSDIERGEREVLPEELARMSEVLRVAVDAFTDPFRLVGEGEFSFRTTDSSSEAITAFQEAAGSWIATHRTLSERVGVPQQRMGQKLELTPRSSYEDAHACAEALRQEWGLGDYPATTLEEAIRRELRALILYVDAPDGVSGAASYLPGLRTIFINRHESRGRQMFDLAHELFHLLTWDAMPPERLESREAAKGKGKRVEQLAENFAAALLMPEATVRKQWENRGDVDIHPWLNHVATSLRVSSTALSYRILNLGLVSKATFKEIDQGRLVANGNPRASISPPLLFSADFVALIHDAVEDGRLSLRRAARLLQMNTGEFADLCREYQLPLSYDV